MPEPQEELNQMDPELEVIPLEDIEGHEPTEPDAEAEAEAEPEPEPEKKIPESVPYGRFQEVYHEGKQSREAAQALYQQNQQLMAMLQSMQQQNQPQRTPKQPVDPEVEAFIKLLKPALDQEQAPLLERLNRQEQVIQQLHQQNASQQAWSWLNGQVPDLPEIASDLMAYIDSRPDRESILADPNRVYDAAQIVRLTRGAKGKQVSNEVSAQVRQASRARGKVELPNTQPRTSTKDWTKASDAEFEKALQDLGF